MTRPRTPGGGELADVMDLDAEIELLRSGSGRSQDPVLTLIVSLRDDIDSRTALLLGQAEQVDIGVLPGSAPTPERSPSGRSRDTEHAATRRLRRRRRLAVIPAVGILVLGSTGVAAALSGSRQAPLYPLHQLIFGVAPNMDAQITRDLADAGKLLDRAATLRFDQRGGSLTKARVILSAAQGLLPLVSSSTARTRFSHQIAVAELRIRQLAQPPAPNARPMPSPGPSTPASTASPAAAAPSAPDLEVPSAPAAAAGVDGGSEAELQPRSGTPESEPAEPRAAPSPIPAVSSQPETPERDGSESSAAEPESDGAESPDS